MKVFSEAVLAFFLIIFFASGCLIQAKQPMCDVDQTSVLCEAAEQLNVKLEHVATVLKLGNVTGLSADAYTAQQASNFITECKAYVQTHLNMTYGDFINAVIGRYLTLEPTVQALFVLFSDDYTLDIEELEKQPLTEYDYYLILKHLDKQRQLVVPFLLAT